MPRSVRPPPLPSRRTASSTASSLIGVDNLVRPLVDGSLQGMPQQLLLDQLVVGLAGVHGVQKALVVGYDRHGKPRRRAAAGLAPSMLAAVGSSWLESRPLGPVLRAVREQRRTTLTPPAEMLDDEVAVALPLQAEGTLHGALAVCVSPELLARGPGLLAELEDVARALTLTLVNAAGKLQNAALQHAANSVVVTDANGAVEWVNPAFEQLWGWRNEELVGRRMNVLKSGSHDAEFYRALWQQLGAGRSFSGEFVNRHRDGHLLTVRQFITPIIDGAQRIMHYVGIQEDLSATRAAESRARRAETHDSITQLPRRALFLQRLEQRVQEAAREEQTLCVLMLDINRFKQVNEILGYAAGDRLLARVGRTLHSALGDECLVARLNGDEFVIATPVGGGAEFATRVCHTLRDALAGCASSEGIAMRTTASVGIAMFPSDADASEALLHNADLALYQAKLEGHDTQRFFSSGLDAGVRRRVVIEQRLRHALQTRALRLHYQPQVRLRDDAWIGVEALARWHDEELGHVSPGEFIPVAEQSGLIVELGNWALDEAAAQAGRWQREGRDVRVAVNISVPHFQQPDFVERVADALGREQLAPRRLEVEITESALALDLEHVSAVINMLTSLGVEIAIDDFGTGYSSLSRLHDLRVDRLKIDASFVRRMEGDGTHLVAAMIAMARGLGISTIAEGVETEAQLQQLRALGCDEVQGYFFARPTPPDQIGWPDGAKKQV